MCPIVLSPVHCTNLEIQIFQIVALKSVIEEWPIELFIMFVSIYIICPSLPGNFPRKKVSCFFCARC